MARNLWSLGLLTVLSACGADTKQTGSASFSAGDLVDINGDNIPDGVAISTTGGAADAIDLNGDGVSDGSLAGGVVITNWPAVNGGVDTNGDGVADATALDTDGNGVADAVDTNGDGKSDGSLLPATGGDGDGDGPNVGDGDGDGGSPTMNGGDGDGDKCASIEKAAELERGPVDIILVVDTSGSMAEFVCNTGNNLTTFANNLGDDAHVVSVYKMGAYLGTLTQLFCGNADPLATTELAKDSSRYLNVPTEVGSHDALELLVRDYDKYKSFLRPNSAKHFVIVTDDESDMSASDFTTQMKTKLGGDDFYFHSIAADGKNGCDGENVGTQYLTLSEQTKGQVLQLCGNWGELFEQLEAAVVASAPLPCDFEIPEVPPGETFDPAKVAVNFTPVGGTQVQFGLASSEDKCGENPGWYYDDPAAPKRVQFCPAACTEVKKGGAVAIGFGCKPDIVY